MIKNEDWIPVTKGVPDKNIDSTEVEYIATYGPSFYWFGFKGRGQRMNYAEEQMKYAEEVKRSFDKINDIVWPLDDTKMKKKEENKEENKTKVDAGKEDVVNHPSHYAESCSIECIDAMEAMFGTDKLISFCYMNAFKYIWRFKNKNGLEDLKKARWYLDKSYELAHSEWATDANVRSEDYLILMEENYLKLDTLLNKAAFKGGFHGV